MMPGAAVRMNHDRTCAPTALAIRAQLLGLQYTIAAMAHGATGLRAAQHHSALNNFIMH